MDIAELSIRVDSAGAIKGITDLDKLTAAAGKAEGAVENVGTASKGAGVGMANLSRTTTGAGNSMRMAAQQLSQVGQQTMATGNFVQALAIQLPNLGLAFGAVGAAVGLLAGIALPLLVNALSGTSGGLAEVQKSLDGSGEAVSTFVSAANAAGASADVLSEKYGTLSVVARDALAAISDVRQIEAISAINAAVQQLTTNLITSDIVGQQMAYAVYGNVLADDFGMAADEAERFRNALVTLQGAQGMQAQAAAAREAQLALMAAYGSVEKMPAPMQQTYAALAQITIQAGATQGALEQGSTFLSSMMGAASSLTGAFNAGAGAAGNLAGQLGEAAKNAWSIAQAYAVALAPGAATRGLADERGSQRKSRQSASQFNSDQWKQDNWGGMSFGSGAKASGGGGSDDFAARLKSLQDELQSEKDLADAWYADAQKTLADRRATEILGEQGHKEALLQVEQEYQQKLAQIAADSQVNRLSDMSNFFGAAQGVATAGGKGMVKIAATFGAVQSTIDAWRAYTQVMADPSFVGRPWARVAAAVSVVGAALKGVAAIRSAGGIGGGGGSGAGTGSIAAQAQQQ
ncbi:MAG: hypothetical protein KA292_11670, partial [Sphingorhabdus sp.]|nr:hypothetical protein [Sphingorhabdus sp.]